MKYCVSCCRICEPKSEARNGKPVNAEYTGVIKKISIVKDIDCSANPAMMILMLLAKVCRINGGK